MVKVQPLNDKILVRVLEEEQKENELFIVKTTKSDLLRGEVLGVGEGITLSTGEVKPLNVNEKDIVYFNPTQALDVKSHGYDCKLVNINQVLGKELV